MLSKDLGGIQQAFINYSQLIRMIGCEPVHIISERAKIAHQVQGSSFKVPNLFIFDLVSIFKIRALINKMRPNIIIAHGNRAISFSYFASKFLGARPKIIGVAHNYSYKHLPKCDYIFCITKAMKDFMINKGIAEEKLLHFPNAIDVGEVEYKARKPMTRRCTIGTIGRFVPKKGIDVLIKAMLSLKNRGYDVELIIGGDGPELPYLKTLAASLNLSNSISFKGWIADPGQFFKEMDIFCLPSLEEPFGIIVIEAMINGVPVIATKAHGPLEIIEHTIDGLLVDIASPDQIAEAVIRYISDPILVQSCVERSYNKVKNHYSIEVSSTLLANHLKHINNSL